MNDEYEPYVEEDRNQNTGNSGEFVVEEESEDRSIDDSLYNDGDNKKPKMIIAIIGIACLIILIIIIAISCSKMNKKSSNNYLTDIKVANGNLSPEFSKSKTDYQITTAEEVVTVICSAESKKATVTGCGKRVYPLDGCVDHEIKVVAENKSERKYNINVCKQDDNAPIIKNVEINPDGFTKNDVVVTVTAESKIPLHKDAYSFDGGLTWQDSNKYVVSENKTLEIKVRNEDNTESAIVSKEIKNIDKSSISVTVMGSTDSGVTTQSDVELTAIPNPEVSASGYKYQWYNGNNQIKGATGSVYIAKSSGNYKVVLSTQSGATATSKEYKVVINRSSGSGGGSTTKPAYRLELSVTGNPTNWTSKDVVLKVNATASNGLASEAYSFDGGKTYQKSNTKTFTSNQTVKVMVKDAKGNKASYNVFITKIDKTTPTVKITGTYSVGSKLTVAVSPASNTYKYQWYRDGKSISATSTTYTPSTTGVYYVVVTTRSGITKKSNEASVVAPVTVGSVSLKGSVGTGTLTGGNVTLTATLSSGTASKYEWYKDNTLYSKCTTNKCVVSDPGTYKVRAITNNGTTGFSGTYNANIDKTAPKVTVTTKVGGPSGSAYKAGSTVTDKVYIKVDATDAKSNLSTFEFQYLKTDTIWYSDPTKAWKSVSINGKTGTADLYISSPGTYSFVARVKDKLGNTTTTSAISIVIKDATVAKPTINLSTTSQTTSNVTFTITKPSSLGSGGKVQYSYDQSKWTDYKSTVTLLNTTGVKKVYARSVDASGKTSAVVSATGKCNKDAIVVDRNSNGVDSGKKCYFILKLNLKNSGLSGITSNKYEYYYWLPKKTSDTTNKGNVDTCKNSFPTTGKKVTTNGLTAKLYQKYSNQYYCFAVRPYRPNDISGLDRWTIQIKLANTTATCASSAYNGN